MSQAESGIYGRIESSFRKQGIMGTIGAELTHPEAGRVTIVLPSSPLLSQQDGFVHAGVIATIADSACGYAALSMQPEGREVLTIEYKINLLAPARGTSFRAVGEVVRQGRTITVCRADVFAESETKETPVATMTATIFALDRR